MPDDWVTTTEWTEEKLRKMAQKLRLRAEKNRAKKARIVEQKITKRLDDALQEKRKVAGGYVREMLDVMTETVRSDARYRGMADKHGTVLPHGVSANNGPDRKETIASLDKNSRPAEKLVKDDVEYGKGPLGISKRMPPKPDVTPEDRQARDAAVTEALREKEQRRLDRHELRRYHNRWIDASEGQAERLHRVHTARAEMRDLISCAGSSYYMLEERRLYRENQHDAAKYDAWRDRIANMTGKELRERAEKRREKATEKQGGPGI